MSKTAQEYADELMPLGRLPDPDPTPAAHFRFVNVDVAAEDRTQEIKNAVALRLCERFQLMYPDRTVSIGRFGINNEGWRMCFEVAAVSAEG
ncbi:hypothetical protein [Pseudomonas paeninsulae]|uniref:hypothetical protein n=1 Tax=Pseudomonas paeninsulae TaxID=3110772 RepID=UPI002D796952|nr:hypothetical protein [Pseudomonas sp. IT1137]